jgi:hypothetical protein
VACAITSKEKKTYLEWYEAILQRQAMVQLIPSLWSETLLACGLEERTEANIKFQKWGIGFDG